MIRLNNKSKTYGPIDGYGRWMEGDYYDIDELKSKKTRFEDLLVYTEDWAEIDTRLDRELKISAEKLSDKHLLKNNKLKVNKRHTRNIKKQAQIKQQNTQDTGMSWWEVIEERRKILDGNNGNTHTQRGVGGESLTGSQEPQQSTQGPEVSWWEVIEERRKTLNARDEGATTQNDSPIRERATGIWQSVKQLFAKLF